MNYIFFPLTIKYSDPRTILIDFKSVGHENQKSNIHFIACKTSYGNYVVVGRCVGVCSLKYFEKLLNWKYIEPTLCLNPACNNFEHVSKSSSLIAFRPEDFFSKDSYKMPIFEDLCIFFNQRKNIPCKISHNSILNRYLKKSATISFLNEIFTKDCEIFDLGNSKLDYWLFLIFITMIFFYSFSIFAHNMDSLFKTQVQLIQNCLEMTQIFTSQIKVILTSMSSGNFFGWKVNQYLSTCLSKFFVYHLIAWKAYMDTLIISFDYTTRILLEYIIYLRMNFINELACLSIILILSSIFYKTNQKSLTNNPFSPKMYFISVLTLYFNSVKLISGLFGSILLDLFFLLTLHLACFYTYSVQILRIQKACMISSWRLCFSGKKWNPLKNRYDTAEEHYSTQPWEIKNHRKIKEKSFKESINSSGQDRHIDRLFISTIFGIATCSCLVPTTICFYLIFSFISIRYYFAKLICYILDFPFLTMIKYFLCPGEYKTIPSIEVDQFSPEESILRLEFECPSLLEVFQESRRFKNYSVLVNEENNLVNLLEKFIFIIKIE